MKLTKLTEKVDKARREKEVEAVKKELRKVCDMAKEEGLDKACDYIEHVLKKDYDSLDYFDESLNEAEGKQIKRVVKIGDDFEKPATIRRIAGFIRDPESGWHAKEENGNLVIVVNVD